MPKLFLNLSFDHELSLGAVSSYKQNLFDPTDHLLDLADELDVPLTFYTDVCCAMRFREWDEKGFYIPYCEQIHRILSSGHEVQLHIHPHWLDSDYRDGRFIPSRSFSLADFQNRPEPYNIESIISHSISFLNDICYEIDKNYKCFAYRAGGFNLAPESIVLSGLYNHGIRIDSSVVKEYKFDSKLSSVDFTSMPSKANWFINPSGPVNQSSEGGIFEITVPSRPRTPINNLPFLLKRVLFSKRSYKSGGYAIHEGNTSFIQKLTRLFPRSVWMLAFDNAAFTINDVMKTFNYHIKKHKDDENIVMAAICHPKLMGEYERSLMAAFIKKVRNKYRDNLKFVSCKEIYDKFISSE